MRSKTVEYVSQARAEIEDAFSWYLERSPAAAQAFLLEIDHALIQVVERPAAWPPFEAGARRYILRRFPYSLIYRETQAAIQIIAVAHQKRRPGYWRTR